MLQKGQEAASYIRNADEKSKVHIIASQWLNVYRIKLDAFEERLTLDDVVEENEATQAGEGARSSHATDEPGLSSRWRRHR
jgi:hypothetical protein